MSRRHLASVGPDRSNRRLTGRAGIALFVLLVVLAVVLCTHGELTSGLATCGVAFSWLTFLVSRRQGR